MCVTSSLCSMHSRRFHFQHGAPLCDGNRRTAGLVFFFFARPSLSLSFLSPPYKVTDAGQQQQEEKKNGQEIFCDFFFTDGDIFLMCAKSRCRRSCCCCRAGTTTTTMLRVLFSGARCVSLVCWPARNLHSFNDGWR